MSDSITFEIERNPFGCGVMYKKSEITFNKGLTILVGCNGSGKTTLINHLKYDVCRKKKILNLSYDNVQDGGSSRLGDLLWYGDFDGIGSLMYASEGEKIPINMNGILGKIMETSKKCTQEDNNIILFLDAVDSGSSIDNILQLKEAIKIIIEALNKKDIDLYVIAVANSYEMANGEDCLDVVSGEHIKFKDYEDYKKFVLNSAKKKLSRNKRFAKWYEREEIREQERKAKKKEKWDKLTSKHRKHFSS